MIDILQKTDLDALLSKLKANEKPQFGSMTPQHMIEHLAYFLRISNGKEPQKHYYPPEKEVFIKEFVLVQNNSMPSGIKSPVLPADRLPELLHPDLHSAIKELKAELQSFEDYFAANPQEKPVNPTMGELNHTEWIKFHNCHFTHHFKQFNLH